MGRFAGSPQDNKNAGNRKRKEACGEERESQPDRKRRKRESVWGDPTLKKGRKVQQVRKPRWVPSSAAHLSWLSDLVL